MFETIAARLGAKPVAAKAEDDDDKKKDDEMKSSKAKNEDDERGDEETETGAEKEEPKEEPEQEDAKKGKGKAKSKGKKADDEEEMKNDDPDEDDEPKAHYRAGFAAGRAAERKRIKAILRSKEAQAGMTALEAAARMAFETNMPPEEAIVVLGAYPADSTPGSSAQRKALQERMAETPNPNVDADAQIDPPTLAQKIIAAGKKRRGEV